MISRKVKQDLQAFADPEKAKTFLRFFKTGKGEYGEGDVFIGVKVPDQRKVAKTYYKEISIREIEKLITSKIHEHRLTALLILTYKYPKASLEEQKEIVDFYLAHTNYINNWDLIDLSAPKILGEYLLDKSKERQILYKFAKSKSLWERRIAILSTYTFIRAGQFDYTLAISEILLKDEHDLIHKGVGWMLREVGNINLKVEEDFLKKHFKKMPRTMLRYAIEKFDEKRRKFYMAK
jgi:3-methyladenine DNA glycosylase AlkD